MYCLQSTALDIGGRKLHCQDYAMTKTLSSLLSPRVIRISESIYVTSNSPDLVLDGGLSESGSRGNSRGGNCDKFPVVFTVVFSKVILILLVPKYTSTMQRISFKKSQSRTKN